MFEFDITRPAFKLFMVRHTRLWVEVAIFKGLSGIRLGVAFVTPRIPFINDFPSPFLILKLLVLIINEAKIAVTLFIKVKRCSYSKVMS